MIKENDASSTYRLLWGEHLTVLRLEQYPISCLAADNNDNSAEGINGSQQNTGKP